MLFTAVITNIFTPKDRYYNYIQPADRYLVRVFPTPYTINYFHSIHTTDTAGRMIMHSGPIVIRGPHIGNPGVVYVIVQTDTAVSGPGLMWILNVPGPSPHFSTQTAPEDPFLDIITQERISTIILCLTVSGGGDGRK